MIGCAFFAWITGRITYILTKVSICTASFDQKMEELNEWMDARKISGQLVERIKGYYMIRFPTMKIFNETRIMDDLPTSLRKEIYIELYRDVVCQVPMFSVCESETQREICYRLRITWKSAQLAVTTEGQAPDSLYIVRFGVVDLYSQNVHLKEIGRGQMFGENALLGLSKSGLRTRTAVARTMVELCQLRDQDLMALMVENDDFFKKKTHMVNGYLQYLELAAQSEIPLEKKDQLCACWPILAEDYKEELRLMASRDATSNPRGSGLTTKLQIHVASLAEEDWPAKEQVAVLRVSWPGYREKGGQGAVFPRAEDESTVIVYGGPGGGSRFVILHQTIGITINHRDADWESMPDVEVSLWKLPRGVHARHHGDKDDPDKPLEVRRSQVL